MQHRASEPEDRLVSHTSATPAEGN